MKDSPAKKGVVLFIVEGISDKIALSLPMSRLLENDRVQFAVLHGDCLNRTNGHTLQIVQGCVKDVMVRYNYKRSDFTHIIHIIDTDGSFIPDERVYPSNKNGVEYFSDRIETGELYETLMRHHRRRTQAEKLSKTRSVMNIPYDVYFMSRNLEHVTQGDGGKVSSNHKVVYAERFADRFADDTYGFLELIEKEGIGARGSYEESWEHILRGVNSLHRLTNINIFLNEYYERIYMQ